MKKVLLTAIIFSLIGCFPFTKAVPEATVLGAKVLKTGVVKIDKDYEEYHASLEACFKDWSEQNRKELEERDKVFGKGFKAMLFAVQKQCEAIEALAGEE